MAHTAFTLEKTAYENGRLARLDCGPDPLAAPCPFRSALLNECFRTGWRHMDALLRALDR